MPTRGRTNAEIIGRRSIDLLLEPILVDGSQKLCRFAEG